MALDLEAIKARRVRAVGHGMLSVSAALLIDDVPQMVAEIEQLRADLGIANEATLVLLARAADAEATVQWLIAQADGAARRVAELEAEVERLRALVDRSRFVADYWRRGILDFKSPTGGWEAHPLCMVLAALAGETDPTLMGIDAASWVDR